MPTIVEKIFAAHERERSHDGTASLDVDQVLIEDATGVMCALQYELLQSPTLRVPLAVMYVDHNVLQIDDRNIDDHRYLQSFSAKYGLVYSRPGNGISHYIHLERFGVPGTILAGADSHTTMAGALGALGIGLGGLDIALAMAGSGITIGPQRVVRVVLNGALAPWTSAKDVVLELLRRAGVRGGAGSIFEFAGAGAAALSVTERGTIANMIMETGATSAVFPSDERTRSWLVAQGRGADWRPLSADADAAYDDEIVIDVDELEPLIALPSSPDNVVPVRAAAGEAVAQVCIGSSVNSSFEDLALVAAILGADVVSEACEVTVTPGSRQILQTIAAAGIYADLVAAGVRMLEPICGPCVGMGQAPPAGVASVRTFNRNFPGRSGTVNDRVFLCSPQTAAATALRGVITDPRTLAGEQPAPRTWTGAAPIDDRHFIAPPPPDRRPAHTIRSANIVDPPVGRPVADDIDASVLIVLPDNISTGDMAPDGALAMAIWANIPECARTTFRRLDPDFPDRAKAAGGGIVVAGHNYGQGSSRESAALVMTELGVSVIAAKSFARIHRANLIAQGVLPLEIPETLLVRRGERWRLDGLAHAIASGEREIVVRRDDGPFTAALNLTSRERIVLAHGGALNEFRATTASMPYPHRIEQEHTTYVTP
jgi:aconitate hydratase